MIFAANVVNVIANILVLCLLIRSVLSWIVYSGNQYGRYSQSPFVRIYNILGAVTEPIVSPVRRFLSRFNTGPFDFAPLGAMILILIVRRILVWLLLL
ncbi:MAG: YggT family protein [Clostridiales Family XIII bacterium]|jgi:YggT family protein|nr:YggT family protein [Clostridiales Family XIII bacterium]